MIAKRVAILQSNYIPWRGYFDIIRSVDEFILYDVVQFTKNDWRNRNQIRTANGLLWLTIPVKTSGRFGQSIADTEIAGAGWAASHWKSIAEAYARAPHFAAYRRQFEEAYAACGHESRLSAVNERLITLVASVLGLPTVIRGAGIEPPPGDRNERLVHVCRSRGAQVYLTGPSARSYIDLAMFAAAGIDVEFMDYSGYRPYPQVHGDFEPHVSVLDLIFNTGESATEHLLPRRR